MSQEVFRAEIVFPSDPRNDVTVGIAAATRQMMGDTPWIVRHYGFATTDDGSEWADSKAAAFDVAADVLDGMACKYAAKANEIRERAFRERETGQ